MRNVTLAEPYKFVEWDINPISELDGTQIAKLHKKIKSGGELTEQEEDYLLDKLINNVYSNVSVPLAGWMFDFAPTLSRYVVKTRDGNIFEVFSPSKRAVTSMFENEYVYVCEVKEEI